MAGIIEAFFQWLASFTTPRPAYGDPFSELARGYEVRPPSTPTLYRAPVSTGYDAFKSLGRDYKYPPIRRSYPDRCWPIGNGRLACACSGQQWFQMGPTRTCSTCKQECNRRRGA